MNLHRTRLVAILAVAAIALAATPISAKTGYQYMIGASFVRDVASDPVASAALDGTHPYINIQTIKSSFGSPAAFPARPPADVPSAWQPIFVYRWASEQQMEADMPHVPSWITACMYDNERVHMTPMTPPEEVAAPVPYYAKAANLCHRAGKLFIASAGMRPQRGANAQTDTFSTANQWDAYSMQTQTGESNLQRFTRTIDRFRQRMLAANPKAKLIVGVGDFAGGDLQSASAIEAAIQAIPPGMAIWMNFGPHNGPGCRSSACPIPARPDLLVQVIKDLARSNS